MAAAGWSLMAWDWDGIDVTVRVAFASDPLATTPTWTDVSDYVRDIPAIFRGTTSEDAPVGPAAGTIVLDNRDRRFDPDYASSPYSPNVKPMKRIEVTVAKGAFSSTIITGWITAWRNEWSLDGDGVSVVSFTDSTWWWANESLPGSAYEAEVLADSPTHYWPLQDVTEEGGTAGDLGSDPATAQVSLRAFGDIDVDFSTIETYVPRGASTGLRNTMVSATPSGFTPQAVEFWCRFYKSGMTSQSVYVAAAGVVGGNATRITVYGNDPSYPGTWSVGYTDQIAGRSYSTGGSGPTVEAGIHHVVVYVSGTTIYMRIDGKATWSASLDAFALGSSSEYMQAMAYTVDENVNSAAISHVAVYGTVPSTARFDEHWRVGFHAWGHPTGETSGVRIGRVLDNIGFSSTLRDIDDGATIQGRYEPAGLNAQQYIDYVTASERGALFVNRDGALAFRDRVSLTGALGGGVVFSDDGGAGAVKYSDIVMEPSTIDTIRNIATVSYSDVGAITQRDQASIDDYGPSPLFIDAPTLPDATPASALAQFEVDQRKDPSTRVSMIRCPIRRPSDTETTDQVEGLLDLELFDRVSVEVTPVGVGSQVVKSAQVLGIQHEITREQWWVTLYLSPGYDTTGWFTLDTSALGGTDVLLP